MKEEIYRMILNYYKKNNSGMTASWVFDDFVKKGKTDISFEEIGEVLEQLVIDSKLRNQAGGFYIPS